MTPEMGWSWAVAIPLLSAFTMVRRASLSILRPICFQFLSSSSPSPSLCLPLTKATIGDFNGKILPLTKATIRDFNGKIGLKGNGSIRVGSDRIQERGAWQRQFLAGILFFPVSTLKNFFNITNFSSIFLIGLYFLQHLSSLLKSNLVNSKKII